MAPKSHIKRVHLPFSGNCPSNGPLVGPSAGPRPPCLLLQTLFWSLHHLFEDSAKYVYLYYIQSIFHIKKYAWDLHVDFALSILLMAALAESNPKWPNCLRIYRGGWFLRVANIKLLYARPKSGNYMIKCKIEKFLIFFLWEHLKTAFMWIIRDTNVVYWMCYATGKQIEEMNYSKTL